MSSNLRARMGRKAAAAAAEAAKKRKSSPAHSLTGGDQTKAAGEVTASLKATLPSDISQKKAKTDEIVDVEKLGSVHVEDNKIAFINDSKFAVSLSQTKLTIFRQLKDLGYYKWTPSGNYMNLCDVTSSDIIGKFDLNGYPPTALPIASLAPQLPLSFAKLEPREYGHMFPHNQSYLPALHVAVIHMGLSLKSVDFVFGGSTLEILANKRIGSSDVTVNKLIATIIAGTNTVLVATHREYTKNLSAAGFQFEQFVVGKPLECADAASVEHLHLMEIAGFTVLFAAEVDAIDDDGNAIEVKTTNPAYRGTRVLLQMISNGSHVLYDGEKEYGTGGMCLKAVTEKSLQEVARSAVHVTEKSPQEVARSALTEKTIEQNIVECLNVLGKATASGVFQEAGKIYEISFNSRSELVLEPSSYKQGEVLLPRVEVVKEMLGMDD